MTEKVFTAREVAKAKGVTVSAVRVAAQRGLLHKIVRDQRVVFAAEEVEEYLRRKPGRRPRPASDAAPTDSQEKVTGNT